MRRLLLLPVLALLCGSGYPGVNNSKPEGAGEPPNESPVWNQTPAPTCQEGVPSSYALVPTYVSDPEGDALTITNQTGCTLPTGVTIDDVNDEVDCAANTTAGTTTGCVFGADDGTNPRVDSSAFPIVVNSGDPFPRLARIGVGGSYDLDATSREHISQFEIVLVGFWAAYTNGGNNMTQLVSDIRSRATTNGNADIELYKYTNISEMNQTPSTQEQIDSDTKLSAESSGCFGRDWYGYTTAEAKVPSGFPGNDLVNATDWVTADTNGDYYPEWRAETVDRQFVQTIGFDGMFIDLWNAHPPNSTDADFDCDDVADDRYDNDVATKWREAHISYITRYASLEASAKFLGNLGGNPSASPSTVQYGMADPANSPEYEDQVYSLSEGVYGYSYSPYTWGTWNTMMHRVQHPITHSLDGISMAHFDLDSNTAYQEVRFTLASCMMSDAYCAISLNYNAGGGDSWWEEFDNNGAGLGYCGNAVDAAQWHGLNVSGSPGNPADPWDGTTFKREFDNCIVFVNPDKASSDTFTIPSAGAGFHWETINGSQPYNDGTTKTSFTLQTEDGVVLLRVAD